MTEPSLLDEPGLPTSLRVIRLQSENIKRIHAISVEPDPDNNLVGVGGKNDQGKTSVLDSIAWAIGGQDLIQEVPIRRGEKSAVIKVDLGELTVERRFTPSGSTLVVKNKDGQKISSPQTLLNKLAGDLTFDPFAFAKLKGQERLDAAMRIAHVDLDDLKREYESVYDERRDVNRDLLSLEQRFSVARSHQDVPLKEVTTTELAVKLQEINQHNQDLEEAGRLFEESKRTLDGIDLEISELESQLATLRARRTATADYRDRAEQEYIAAGQREDPQATLDQIEDADIVNKKVRENVAYLALKTDTEAKRKQSEEMTAQLTAIQEEKKARLASATFPIEGLTFGENDILFNGLPVEQAAKSQQTRLFFAMSVAMNKPLRICLIRDGSLLDKDNLAQLGQLADEFDVQAWIELIGDGEEVSVIIEDGFSTPKPRGPYKPRQPKEAPKS